MSKNVKLPSAVLAGAKVFPSVLVYACAPPLEKKSHQVPSSTMQCGAWALPSRWPSFGSAVRKIPFGSQSRSVSALPSHRYSSLPEPGWEVLRMQEMSCHVPSLARKIAKSTVCSFPVPNRSSVGGAARRH